MAKKKINYLKKLLLKIDKMNSASILATFLIMLGIIIYLLSLFIGITDIQTEIKQSIVKNDILIMEAKQTNQQLLELLTIQKEYTHLGLNAYFIEVLKPQAPMSITSEMFVNGTYNKNFCLLLFYAQTEYLHKEFLLGNLDSVRDNCQQYEIYLQ